MDTRNVIASTRYPEACIITSLSPAGNNMRMPLSVVLGGGQCSVLALGSRLDDATHSQTQTYYLNKTKQNPKQNKILTSNVKTTIWIYLMYIHTNCCITMNNEQ